MLFAMLFLNGCTTYVDRKVEVKVPVPCKIKGPNCADLKNLSDEDVVIELYRCILLYKENVKVCQ